jgi:hypothetical protein
MSISFLRAVYQRISALTKVGDDELGCSVFLQTPLTKYAETRSTHDTRDITPDAFLASRLYTQHSLAKEDLALIPDYPDEKEVEVSKAAWPLVSAVVRSVTIARIRCVPNGLSPNRN